MQKMSPISFIVHVGNDPVYEQEFEKYFLSSPLFAQGHGFDIVVQRGFQSAALAYADGIEKTANDLVVFAHLDTMYPVMWADRFMRKLAELEAAGEPVGVVGCIGITSDGRPAGHVYRHDREFFPVTSLPAEVETLDGLILAIRKSSGLRFDTAVPHFFVHAIDLCLQASAMGLKNFALDAPCFHQAKMRQGAITREEFEGLGYLAKKWKHSLPVQELSGTVRGKRFYSIYWLGQRLRRVLLGHPKPWWGDLPRINPEKILFDGLAAAGHMSGNLPDKDANIQRAHSRLSPAFER
ncbi:MAG: hypothetical protein ACR2IF_10090 [Terriglobales bacterium]